MSRNKGLLYERKAEQWLKQQGLKPLYQNYSCRYGEIDLIMLDTSCLCFIEVKYRTSQRYGGAAYSITPTKQQKLILTAQYFLSKNQKYHDTNARFDALLIDRLESLPGNPLWIKNAFSADGH